MCRTILLSICFALALGTGAVCEDDDAAISAAYGDDITCELMASFSMCHEVGPEGEGAISDICECSCEGDKMIDISREEAVGGRADRRTRIRVMQNAGQYPSCGDWIDLGRKSKYGCGFFWAFECRWCVEKKHFNAYCHKQKSWRRDVEFKGNELHSGYGRVYYSDFANCFKNHGTWYLNSYKSPNGNCYDLDSPECAKPLDIDLEFVKEINDHRRRGSHCEVSDIDGTRKTVYKPNPVPLKFDCGLWDMAHEHSKMISTKDIFDWSDENGYEDGSYILGSKENGFVFAFAGASFSKAQMSFWHSLHKCNDVMNTNAKSIGVARVHNPDKDAKYYWTLILGHQSQTVDSSCLQSAETGEGLALTSNAQSAMIASEDLAMYGFAIVGLIVVLFFLRSACRSHFSEYKIIDETTTLEEVSA